MSSVETTFAVIFGPTTLLLAASAMIFVAASRWSQRRSPTQTAARVTPADRARALLLDILDEREYQQLERCGYLDVSSPVDTQRIYRIPACGGLVRVYQGGYAARELCVQSAEPLPSADVVAMHKLMIQGSEQEYLARARQYPPLQPNLRYRR